MKNLIQLSCMFLITTNISCTTQSYVFTKEVKDNIKARVDNEVNTGIVVGVVTTEGTSFYSYGVKSLETNDPVNENTVFEIGSISKTFTGILLADEVVNGKLNLDDPLQKLLPKGVTAPTRNGESITLLNLANHTSALPRVPGNFKRTNYENPYADLSLQHTYNYLNNYELTYDIGSKFLYSNYGMGILGNVLADRNNTDYEGLMLYKIAKPLGMSSTSITINPNMAKNLAYGHRLGVEVANWNLPAIAGAGAIRSTAADMLEYLAANMGLKKTELYRAMTLSHKYTARIDTNMTIGLGWITSIIEGEEITWHNGGTGGYMTFAGFNQNEYIGVVVLSNSDAMPDDIGLHILNPKSKLKNPKPSIATKLNKLVEQEGLDVAIKSYGKYKSKHADKYDFSSGELNKLGYMYLHKNQLDEALAIFKLVVDDNPENWNAHDSYAEALLKNNEEEKAIKHYRKSIALNPSNIGGIKILRKLGVEI